ncbi:hypothetical protein Svir_07820 [Saccharomonospora viridis DSM 43017]|uniref:Excreted virulence factor EspC, type VII ESX diderm n=1 Tax=Saccharomonospora viridis (strain ATCC 15386 / DSM 43017 / JCM 3036 / CCUG 5913 / NBRC 12207 / NCIMB 9602 / P101) TaxID=471857 RepID=C7MWI6_SACVD|nr:hypothetical protein Svir_07820 [Saccharomonospora viridis DSM 43017]
MRAGGGNRTGADRVALQAKEGDVDGTPHAGFWVEEGAYDHYARSIDPTGDDVRQAADRHVTPNVELSGDGLSMLGAESGLSGAYTARMRNIQERLSRLGGNWQRMADAARRTSANYEVVEAEQQATIERLGKELR